MSQISQRLMEVARDPTKSESQVLLALNDMIDRIGADAISEEQLNFIRSCIVNANATSEKRGGLNNNRDALIKSYTTRMALVDKIVLKNATHDTDWYLRYAYVVYECFHYRADELEVADRQLHAQIWSLIANRFETIAPIIEHGSGSVEHDVAYVDPKRQSMHNWRLTPPAQLRASAPRQSIAVENRASILWRFAELHADYASQLDETAVRSLKSIYRRMADICESANIAHIGECVKKCELALLTSAAVRKHHDGNNGTA
jgi:hypothetical protein